MPPKSAPRPTKGGPRAKTDPNKAQNEPPGGPQNGSKNALFWVLGHRGATKGPQGLSRYPLKLKSESKLT